MRTYAERISLLRTGVETADPMEWAESIAAEADAEIERLRAELEELKIFVESKRSDIDVARGLARRILETIV